VRADVLRAALEQLAAGGYAAFTIESVAKRAGVHKTTLYRRWGTRERLLLEAMLERGAETVPIPDTGSLEADLREYGRLITASLEPEIEAAIRAVVAIGQADEAVAAAGRRFWAARFELAGVMVARAIARGELPAGTDPVLVIEAVLAPIYFRLLLSGGPLDDASVARLAKTAARS
jgi:AcrR family transcriptional regulator